MSQDATAIQDGSPEIEEPTAKFERDELVRGWREYEQRRPRVVPVLRFAARTDMGQVRENNEDKFDFYEVEDPSLLAARGCLFAVGDGIGGAQAGQIASEMTLKLLIANYYNSSSPDVFQALLEAVIQANDRVYHLAQMIPERNGMGTTLTGIVFIEDRAVVVQVGDSRAYLIRQGEITQVSQDHSWVEENVRAGLMSREDADNSPYRNVITRSVGAGTQVQPDFFEQSAMVGDIWILCSDGLTGYVQDDELLKVGTSNAPSEAARQFIELANARGGRDNITVFVIAVRGMVNGDEGTALLTGASKGAGETKASPDSAGALQHVPISNDEDRGEKNRSGLRRLFGR